MISAKTQKVAARLFLASVMMVTAHSSFVQDAWSQSSAQTDLFAGIPSKDSLKNHREFVLLDDFSSGKLSEKKEEMWQVNASRKTKLKLSISSEDGRAKNRGHSLQIVFKVPALETVQLNRSLHHLDISQATHFVFRSKMDLSPTSNLSRGSLVLSVTDRTLNKREIDLTAMIHPDNTWQTIAVPMSQLTELDLDQLLMLSFKIKGGGTGLEGTWKIDDVAFYGTGDLNFESSRDNIVQFPHEVFSQDRRAELQQTTDNQKFLTLVAQDTWGFFKYSKNKKTQLIVDNIKLGQDPMVSGYTSPTNIAMDLLAIIAAKDLGFISKSDSLYRTRAVISVLAQMKKHKGFFFNFYETKNLLVTRPYVSSVDNGWLAIALVVVRQTYSELWEPVSQILNAMNFNEFYDTETNQMVIGYDVQLNNFGGNHYGMLVSEARAMSFLAIGKGDIPVEHWWYLYRTPPAVWKWQSQVPKGEHVVRDGNDYFQGYYTYKGKRFVPSWGGSLFEFLMPTLVLDEKRLAPKGLGLNDRIATELHRDYALQEKKYPVWGISPASVLNGKSWMYEEYGVKSFGVKGYVDRAVITPHVSFLALDSLPQDAIANIRKFLDYNMYGEYGFFDTLDVRTMKPNTLYLSLDQGMSLVALCNYLKDGSIKKRFHKDPIGKRAETLLMKESFFKE